MSLIHKVYTLPLYIHCLLYFQEESRLQYLQIELLEQ